MKDYLRSAAGLIKQYAWAFPAFKKPEGVNNPFEMDLGMLSEEELEAILDFAFERYFEDSGLFGTIQDACQRVEQLKRIGVDEIACLIDYGIAPDVVLEGLKPLAEVLRLSNAPQELAADDFSLAAQIVRHGVSHMQCTPSMARMIAADGDASACLGQLQHLLVGGEALPGDLVQALREATNGRRSTTCTGRPRRRSGRRWRKSAPSLRGQPESARRLPTRRSMCWTKNNRLSPRGHPANCISAARVSRRATGSGRS